MGNHEEVAMVVGALGFVALVGLLLGAWLVLAKQMRRPRIDSFQARHRSW